MLRRLPLELKTLRHCLRPCHHEFVVHSHRKLSSQETSTALRPFYFAVHPDLFGRHPKERAVNEDSMKKLQQYLENLHQKRRNQPTCITFYTRNPTNTEESLKKIEINLYASTVRAAVISILKSCDLSLDFVDNVPAKGHKGPTDRPIKWDASYYAFYGIPNPFAPRRQPEMNHSIKNWLKNNVGKAHKNLHMVEPVRHQTSRMVNALKADTGMTSILWDSSWGPAQFRACLLCLQRLIMQHEGDIDLNGRSIIFCNDTGISLHGAMLLRTDDVQDTWFKAIKYDKHPSILGTIPMSEKKLSHTLNNIQIVRPGKKSAVLAREYIQQVNRLTNTVNRYYQEKGHSRPDEDYSDMKMTIKCATGSLTLGCDGVVLVPSSCPGFMIVEYLRENSQQIRRAQQTESRLWEEKLELMDRVTNEFSLLSLAYDHNVSWPQIQQCCNRLLSTSHDLDNLLEGCRLKVAQFYSVMSDGEICIPWNWKEDRTNL